MDIGNVALVSCERRRWGFGRRGAEWCACGGGEIGDTEWKSESRDGRGDTGDRFVEIASSRAIDRGSSVIPGPWYGESDTPSAFPLPLSIEGCAILSFPDPPSIVCCLDIARSTD